MWRTADLFLFTAADGHCPRGWSTAGSFPNALCGVARVGHFCGIVANPPFTRNQVELMQTDNVASPQMPGFGDLSISPSAVEQFIRHLVGAT